MHCEYCNTGIESGNFCPRCGEDIGDSIFCPKCGVKKDKMEIKGIGRVEIIRGIEHEFWLELNQMMAKGDGKPLFETFNVTRISISVYPGKFKISEVFFILVAYEDKMEIISEERKTGTNRKD